MPTTFGPHLLGREPSTPDERDWKIEEFLGTDADLVNSAVLELKRTTVGYRYYSDKGLVPGPTTHWYKALAYLGQIAPQPPPPAAVEWIDNDAVLDQGDYGTCVGNGWAQWGNTLPYDDHYIEKDARAIYYESTVIGGSPDNPDAPGGGQQGSTVRDGAKAMQNRSRLSAYAFASTTDAITAYVTSKGPVVVGTDWTNDMFNPDSNGYVYPTGSVDGGHCFLLHGYDPSKLAYKFLNSWGVSWGLAGHFFMKVADFAKLFANHGEACCSLELAV